MIARPAISIIDLIDDEALLARWYRGPSWNAARMILKATHGLRLVGAERKLFRELAGDRDPPTAPVKVVTLKCGRRFGKDSLSAGDMTYSAAVIDHRPFLRAGERACCLCLAVDKAQARTFLGYVRGYFEGVPMLKELVTGETKEGLTLSNGVDIVVTSSNFRAAARGRTLAHCVLNECAFLPDEGSANPDVELYRSLLPALATLPTSRLMVISSPYKRSGLLYDLVTKHYGRNSDVLVFTGTSRQGNPTLDQAIIDRALEEDPEGAKAEWLGEWRDGVSNFLPREVIEALVDRDVTVRPPILEGLAT